MNTGNINLVVELHLNAGGDTGSEVLYVSNAIKIYADRVQAKLATIFRNRGVKNRENLYTLNSIIKFRWKLLVLRKVQRS